LSKRYWLIRGYEGTSEIFATRVSIGHFSEEQIKGLLRSLAAKAGLTFDEIVGAYAKRKSRISNNLLSIHKDFAQPVWMCGENPHFTAAVVDEKGGIILRSTKLHTT